jgi:hypothetical protein
MGFLAKLLQGISFVPAIVHGVEGLFGNKSGNDKRAAALSFIQSAVGAADAISSKTIVDPNKFQDGLGLSERLRLGLRQQVDSPHSVESLLRRAPRT